jgi:NAD(P)-dependent dehydrogenase (short-subunit alcohol dehydrogenase family)
MDLNLKGRVALVTGGGRDVGREISTVLAREGAFVAVNYRNSESEAAEVIAEIEKQGGRAKAYKADIANYDDVKKMVAEVAKDFGGLDILVNNAGFVITQKFTDSKPEDWKRQLDVCLYGAIHCCHAAAPHLNARKQGRIISFSGDSSRVGESNLAMAAAGRAGVIALMKSLAKEFGRFGTTANTLSLGLIETSHSNKAWLDENRDKILRQYAIRRLGKPEDVGGAVAFLASDHGQWITGQVLSINGGFAMVG